MLTDAVDLLIDLIRIPSFSREEAGTADCLTRWFESRDMHPHRKGNNLWLRGADFQPHRPTLLLCSHHDTVRPVASWKGDPFEPVHDGHSITGLGSNDAGASVAAMSVVFAALRGHSSLPFNLVLALTAEEEIAGDGGIVSILRELGQVDLALVGEPTGMQMATAEKGLLVLDCTASGEAGHAARSNGVNAIMRALPDIAWFDQYRFEKNSPVLGEVKMTVTQIAAGTQHNVIPDTCRFVVDVRVTEQYTHEELLEIIRAHVACDVQPRSMRLRPSAIAGEHAIVRAAEDLGIECFGSVTMSDQALLSIPSVKIGPGLSERSHTAGEFVRLQEIEAGISGYLALLQRFAERIA